MYYANGWIEKTNITIDGLSSITSKRLYLASDRLSLDGGRHHGSAWAARASTYFDADELCRRSVDIRIQQAMLC